MVDRSVPAADDGDALVPGTGSSLAPRFSLVSEGLLKEQLHAVSWIPALGSGIPRTQIIAGFPVDFETGRINASHLAVVFIFSFWQSKHVPPPRRVWLCERCRSAFERSKCKMNGLPLIWECGGYFIHTASLRNVWGLLLVHLTQIEEDSHHPKFLVE